MRRAGTVGTVADLGEADYDQTMDLNLKSVYFTVQKGLPYMNDGASIILDRVKCGTPGLSKFYALWCCKSGCYLFCKSIFKRPFSEKDQGKCNNTRHNRYTSL